jgi:hypothetical protein
LRLHAEHVAHIVDNVESGVFEGTHELRSICTTTMGAERTDVEPRRRTGGGSPSVAMKARALRAPPAARALELAARHVALRVAKRSCRMRRRDGLDDHLNDNLADDEFRPEIR